MKLAHSLAPLALALGLFSATSAHANEGVAAASTAEPTTNDTSSAEAPESKGLLLRPGFGARVGGYGFRGEGSKWDDCRMNGFGVFGTLDLTKHAFLELGLDSYQLLRAGGESSDMDRVSILTSVAGGLRMFPDFFITPYVQIGAGVEWTRVDIMGQRTTGTYPIGFIGLGAELNLGDHLRAGAVMRMLGMAHPNHDGEDSIVYRQEPTKMEYQPATQGQFYVRYAL
jgi:hypothetical protein